MKPSYTYSPLPKKLIKNPMEIYYNPLKEFKVFNRATGVICICKYISFVVYFGYEGYISFYDCFGNEVTIKAYKEEKICDEFFKCLERIEKGQIVCEGEW